MRADLQGRQEVLDVAELLPTGIDSNWHRMPFIEAIESFREKVSMDRVTFDALDDSHKRRSFTVAGLQSEYVIKNIKSYLQAGIETGASKERIMRDINQAYDALGVTRSSHHHIETVVRTNIETAYAHGRYQQQRDPVMMAMRPYWRYTTAGDERVRPSHAAMNDRVYSAEDPIWNEWYPPNGFNCRCSVEAISGRKAHEIGISSDAPTDHPDEGFASAPSIDI